MFYTNTRSLSRSAKYARLQNDLCGGPDEAGEARHDVEGVDACAELDVCFQAGRTVRPRVQPRQCIGIREREQLGRNGRVGSGPVVDAGDDPSGAVGIVEGEGALETGAED